MATNDYCNDSGPHAPGEVRVMPHSDAPLCGNDILCRRCWDRELRYRADRNRNLAEYAKYALPRWEDAQVYGDGDVSSKDREANAIAVALVEVLTRIEKFGDANHVLSAARVAIEDVDGALIALREYYMGD
jgi:hypothetical protein